MTGCSVCFNPCFNGICPERRKRKSPHPLIFIVSILVLMEFVLKAENKNLSSFDISCFNPCFNGICPESCQDLSAAGKRAGSFNPCFNGICPERAYRSHNPIEIAKFQSLF